MIKLRYKKMQKKGGMGERIIIASYTNQPLSKSLSCID